MARKKKDPPTPALPDIDAIRHNETRKKIPTEELRDFVAADDTAGTGRLDSALVGPV